MEEDYTVTYGRYASQLPTVGVTLEEICGYLGWHQSENQRYKYVQGLMYTSGLMPRSVPAAAAAPAAAVATATGVGERLLAAGSYSRALHVLTGCMVHTRPGTLDHAHVLHYRAKTLFRMGLHEGCAEDLRRVMRTPREVLPHGLWSVTVNSYGRVMDTLGRGGDATSTAGRPEPTFVRRPLTAAAAQTDDGAGGGSADRVAEERDRRPYVVAGARHALCPAFAEHVEFRQTADMGLGVYTTRDLEPGDVVAIEDSYIGIPLEDNYYICSYSDCQKPNMVVYFCTNCTLVYYCSESCLVKDREEGGHNYECPILHAVRNLPGNKIFNQLALKWFLRESTKMGLDEYCSTITLMSENHLNLFSRKYIENGRYDNFVSAYSMDIDSASTKHLLFLNCVVVEMLHYLLLSGYQIPVHHLPTVGASLVHMVQVLEKCFKLYKTIVPFYMNTTYIDGQKLVDMGFSVYPSLNQINHSCDPNIMIRHLIDKRTIVLRASRPIPKGSQLFINYGKHFYQHDKEERCLYLQQSFNFQCCCQPCNENWPTYRTLPLDIEQSQIIVPAIFQYSIYLTQCQLYVSSKNELLNNNYTMKNFSKYEEYFLNFLKFLFTYIERPCFYFEDCHDFILRNNELRLIDSNCFELLKLKHLLQEHLM